MILTMIAHIDRGGLFYIDVLRIKCYMGLPQSTELFWQVNAASSFIYPFERVRLVPTHAC